jgi:hypothetical protein
MVSVPTKSQKLCDNGDLLDYQESKLTPAVIPIEIES